MNDDAVGNSLRKAYRYIFGELRIADFWKVV
jgi:hypothetical protein